MVPTGCAGVPAGIQAMPQSGEPEITGCAGALAGIRAMPRSGQARVALA